MSDLDRIVAFLRAIGLEVVLGPIERETFLPGLRVERGGLHVDPERLEWPGDLLHEAGHLALAPPDVRSGLTGDVSVPGMSMRDLESAVKPWSYAAALHIGIDPAVVFHEGGYHGYSEGILRTFGFGVYPGAPLLEAAGLTATGARAAGLGVPPFPHMLRWLRA